MGDQIVGRVPSRGRQAGMDMVRSLGLVALVLGAMLWLGHPRTPDAVREVPWFGVAQSAVQAASYEVLAPPAGFGWAATSARVEPQSDGTVIWRAGFLTPAGDYAGLLQRGEFPEQAAQAQQEWVQSETRQGVLVGSAVLGDREWTRLEGDPTPDERRSLVSTTGGTTTIITGSAAWSELEQLAASIGPVAVGVR